MYRGSRGVRRILNRVAKVLNINARFDQGRLTCTSIRQLCGWTTSKLPSILAGGARTSLYGRYWRVAEVFGHQFPDIVFEIPAAQHLKPHLVEIVSEDTRTTVE
jgi:hypothetical protein